MSKAASLDYLKTFYGWLEDALKNRSDSEDPEQISARAVVFEVALKFLLKHFEAVSSSIQMESNTRDAMRQQHLDTLIAVWEKYRSILSASMARQICAIALECMISYSDLLSIYPSLRSCESIDSIFEDSGSQD